MASTSSANYFRGRHKYRAQLIPLGPEQPLVIVSFKHKGLKNLFINGVRKGINPQHASKLTRLLDRLDAAEEIRDMNAPGFHLHLLEPKQTGIWSVRVSGNWRLTFRFEAGKAYDVDYIDYH